MSAKRFRAMVLGYYSQKGGIFASAQFHALKFFKAMCTPLIVTLDTGPPKNIQ